MSSTLQLPSYQDQSPEVAARFAKLKSRPVILETRKLTKTFHNHTPLNEISLQVFRRELLCVVGPSGCGKSTFIRIIAGLETPTSGEVAVEGRPVSGPGSDRGMVFQGYTLFPWLTVKRNVMFGLQVSGKSAFEAEGEAREWINLVGLS
ncbi:MAG TPA: ATP-binding cassette domain-containing protein, partial [Chthoniobacterales bacterium]